MATSHHEYWERIRRKKKREPLNVRRRRLFKVIAEKRALREGEADAVEPSPSERGTVGVPSPGGLREKLARKHSVSRGDPVHERTDDPGTGSD